MDSEVTRREFHRLAAASVLAAAAGSAPLAQDAPRKAPEKARTLRLGFIGVGRRGTSLLSNTLAVVPNVTVAAICDLVEESAKRAASIVTGRGLPEPAVYTRVR